MMNKEETFSGKSNVDMAIRFALLTVLGLSLYCAALQIANRGLDGDELQHAHIAWNTYIGKVIYRDFFDHHGPLYPIVNKHLFQLLDLKPEFQSIIVLRYTSLFYLVAMVGLTYGIGRRLFDSPWTGLISSVILSALFVFQNKAIELRPDGIQNAFWLLGFLLVVLNFEKQSRWMFFVSGLVFGLATLSNSKAAIGPAFIIAALLIIYSWTGHIGTSLRKMFGVIGTKLLWLVLGILCSHFTMFVYFWTVGGGYEYYFFNYRINLMSSAMGHPPNFKIWSLFFLTKQSLFIFCLLWGVLTLVRLIRLPGERSKKNKVWLLLLVTVGTMLGALLDLYEQYYLIFLPLLSIIASYGIMTIPDIKREECIKGLRIAPLLLLACTLVNLEVVVSQNVRKHEDILMRSQRELTDFIVEKTPRSEPIGFLWNACGGYVFNEDVQYYWQATGMRYAFNKIAGYNVFGEKYVEALKEKDVSYIVSPLKQVDNRTSSSTAEYIRKNYSLQDCLWTRKF